MNGGLAVNYFVLGTMEITYSGNRIRKICTDDKMMLKELGQVGVKILLNRLEQIKRFENLELLRFEPGNWHELTGDRFGQLSCSLNGLNRLVFEPGHDSRPLKPDGGLDWARVTAVEIVEITDYH